MSQSFQTATPKGAEQDQWIARFTGVEARRGPVTIGGQRTPPVPPPTPWQSATPSDENAPKMAQPRDLKLAEIDSALKTLETAADAIGAPLGRTAVEPAILQAKTGRDALANAADRGEIAKQLAAAPALLEAIEAARLAAIKDKADCEAHAAKVIEVNDALTAANEAADGIGAPLARTAVDQAIKDAETKRDTLANAATRDAIATEMQAAAGLLQEIETARLAAVQDKADCEAHAAKVIEVNAALKVANEAADAIGKPLTRTAVDQAIKDAEIKRDTLANAATRDAIATQMQAAAGLLQEIDTARLAAVQDKADCEDLAIKLQEVDTDLQTLNDTADLITGPLARATVDPDILKVTTARDDLANAATRGEITTQIAAQPALLQEIETARLAAEQAEQDWQALLVRKDTAAESTKTIGNLLSWLPAGTAQKGLEKRRGEIDKSIKDLDTAADLQKYTDELDKIEIATNTLYQEADVASTPPWADAKLAELGKWLPVIKKIAATNPVKAKFDALTVRKNNAGSATDPTAELTAVGNEATDAANGAKQVYKLDQSVTLYLGEATGNVGSVSDPTFKNNLQTWIGDARTNRLDAYKVASIAELLSNLDDVKATAMRLSIATAGIDTSVQAVKDSLAEADTAIQQLTSGVSPRTELEVTYGDLDTRLTNLATEADYWTKADKLNVLNKEALALAEEARTAEFKAKAATVEGKKQIDELIKTFGTRTDDPVQQAVIRAAMQACYGVNIKAPEGMSVKTLPSLYDMMTKMPPTDFKGLKKIKYETDPLINTSYYGDKKVVLNALDESEGDNHTLTNQKDPNKKELVNYLNFTALHEFGHHVDDENSVMGDNGKKTGFGQWKKEDIDSVVEAVYTAAFATLTTVTPPPTEPTTDTSSGGGTEGTGGGAKKETKPPPPPPTEADLRLLVRTLLETGAAKKPASATVKPLGTLFNAWDKIEGKDGWKKCLAIRDSESSPWDHPTEIGADRAFHEGYEGDWYSYSISERTSGGISSYQFRSPVEWFAEQYAFYRLKPGATKPSAIATYLSM